MSKELERILQEEIEPRNLFSKVLKALRNLGIDIDISRTRTGLVLDFFFCGRREMEFATEKTAGDRLMREISQVIIEESLIKGDYKTLYGILKDDFPKIEIDLVIYRESSSVLRIKERGGFGLLIIFSGDLDEEVIFLFKLLIYLRTRRRSIPFKVFKKVLTFAKVSNYF